MASPCDARFHEFTLVCKSGRSTRTNSRCREFHTRARSSLRVWSDTAAPSSPFVIRHMHVPSGWQASHGLDRTHRDARDKMRFEAAPCIAILGQCCAVVACTASSHRRRPRCRWPCPTRLRTPASVELPWRQRTGTMHGVPPPRVSPSPRAAGVPRRPHTRAADGTNADNLGYAGQALRRRGRHAPK